MVSLSRVGSVGAVLPQAAIVPGLRDALAYRSLLGRVVHALSGKGGVGQADIPLLPAFMGVQNIWANATSTS